MGEYSEQFTFLSKRNGFDSSFSSSPPFTPLVYLNHNVFSITDVGGGGGIERGKWSCESQVRGTD